MVLGAHDLILHILEPSLEQRATLCDITAHHWLQDYVSPRPDMNCVDSLSSGSIKLSDGSSKENLSTRLPEFDNNCSSDNCRTSSAPVSAFSSFHNSLSVREDDAQSLSVSSSCSINMVSVDDEVSSQSVAASDYIPLHCDTVVVGQLLRLSDVVTFEEYKEDCHRNADNRLISTPVIPADIAFRSSSAFTSRIHRSRSPLSDAKHATLETPDTKLPRSFSADSLEISANGNHRNSLSDNSNDEAGRCRHSSDVENLTDDEEDSNRDQNSQCGGNYDLADIDAVLDHIASDIGWTGADVDTSSQVSHDSLEDGV